jgi:hypothetical protein
MEQEPSTTPVGRDLPLLDEFPDRLATTVVQVCCCLTRSQPWTADAGLVRIVVTVRDCQATAFDLAALTGFLLGTPHLPPEGHTKCVPLVRHRGTGPVLLSGRVPTRDIAIAAPLMSNCPREYQQLQSFQRTGDEIILEGSIGVTWDITGSTYDAHVPAWNPWDPARHNIVCPNGKCNLQPTPGYRSRHFHPHSTYSGIQPNNVNWPGKPEFHLQFQQPGFNVLHRPAARLRLVQAQKGALPSGERCEAQEGQETTEPMPEPLPGTFPRL